MCIAMLTGRTFAPGGSATPQSRAGDVEGGTAPAASAAPAVSTVRRVSVGSTFPDAPGSPPGGAGEWLKLLHMDVELTRSGLLDAVPEPPQRFRQFRRAARPGAGGQQCAHDPALG